MKLSFRTRVSLAGGALIVALIGIGMAAAGLFGLIDLRPTLTLRLALLGMGIFLLLYAAFVLFLPRRVKKTQESFMVQQTAGGELRISMKAIESIVRKCVENAQDVKLSELNVDHARGTVRIDLRVAMPGNVSIPLAAENLQKQIKKQIQSAAGIDATEVRVSVEMSDNTALASPYQIEKPVEKAAQSTHISIENETPRAEEGTEDNGEQ